MASVNLDQALRNLPLVGNGFGRLSDKVYAVGKPFFESRVWTWTGGNTTTFMIGDIVKVGMAAIVGYASYRLGCLAWNKVFGEKVIDPKNKSKESSSSSSSDSSPPAQTTTTSTTIDPNTIA